MSPQAVEARPCQPSRASTWGWRAALLMPVGLGGLKLSALRDETLSPTAALLTVFCVGALAQGSVQVWRIAGTPRLTYSEAMSVHHAIPRPQRRVIHRALHRRGPLPFELRRDAARTLWASRNQMAPWIAVPLAGANLMPNGFLLERPVWLLACTILIGLVLSSTLTMLIGQDRRLRRRAHELQLPLEPQPVSVDTR